MKMGSNVGICMYICKRGCTHIVKHPTLTPDQAQWQSRFRNHTAESTSKKRDIVQLVKLYYIPGIVVNSMISNDLHFFGSYSRSTNLQERYNRQLLPPFWNWILQFFQQVYKMYISTVPIPFVFCCCGCQQPQVRIHHILIRTR